jgi:acetyltransferase-like isoleucine patch superfamily enzyme
MLGDNAVVVVADSDPVYIGNNVALSEGSYLRSSNHGIDDWEKPITLQEHTSKKIPYKGSTYSIVIEDDVWMAAHTVILTGAFIGKGSVVSAGAVVSSEIPPYSIVVGNPARAIANRKKLAEMKQDIGVSHAKI